MTQRRMLYVGRDASERLRLDGPSICIQQRNGAARRIPLRSVARAVIQTDDRETMLAACLAMVHEGTVVHFVNGHGTPVAILRPVEAPDKPIWRELASLIEHYGSPGPIHRWRDDQVRHAFSLWFRRGAPGDPQRVLSMVSRYVQRALPAVRFEPEWTEVRAHIDCWTQSRIIEDGLSVVADAIAAQHFSFAHALSGALAVTTMWEFAKWRRRQRPELQRKELIAFVEMLGQRTLLGQFHRHVDALWYHYRPRAGHMRELQLDGDDGD